MRTRERIAADLAAALRDTEALSADLNETRRAGRTPPPDDPDDDVLPDDDPDDLPDDDTDSATDQCECPCSACRDGRCEDCSEDPCDFPSCNHGGRPDPGDDDE